jgi:MoxR-like ATPase
VNKIEFESPIDIGQVLDELVDLESVDRPDTYPFSPTGLGEITIGELGDNATETILEAIDIDLTYSEAVPEHDFGSPPRKADIENLYYPGENVLSEIIDQMNQALRDGHHIVLVGPPGTGKSELAKQVASSLTDQSFTMVTATADWSSFDTIGGYQPEGQSGLHFSPGVFLERFQDEDGNPKNEWLIVDELNRANVDKAFGPLFSTLADDSVTTSFKDDQGNEIELVTKKQVAESPTVDHRYCIPDTWRLIATMNTHDKMSLFDLSYAFIRRFAFIHVGAPDESEIETEDIKEYLRRWGIEIIEEAEDTSTDEGEESDEEEEPPESPSNEGASEPSGATLSEDWVEQIEHFWSNLQPHRAVGPAVIEKVATTLCKEDVDLTRPTKMYVIPQLEDLPRQTQIAAIESLLNSDVELRLDGEEIISFSEDYLGLDSDNISA